MKGVSLATAISHLRSEITQAISEGSSEDIQFRLGVIELELQVEIESSDKADANVKAWVVSIGGSSDQREKATHTVKLSLEALSHGADDVLISRRQ